jgi:hypothetical protein
MPQRRLPYVAAALAVAIGATAASGLGLTANAALKPAAAPSAEAGPAGAAPVADTHPVKFGLDYAGTLFDETPSQVRASLTDAVDVGAKWIRVDLPWEVVQPEDSSSYQWGGFDTIVRNARSLGLSVDAILDSTAYWDTDHACKASGVNTELCPPADMAQFAQFAATATRRYENQGVDAWEIWNEPNIAERWWPAPSPSGYTQMLDTVAQAVRGVDPHAYILMGGLAAVPDDAARGYVSQNTFLTDVVQTRGALADVDAISYHPFSAPTPPSTAGDFQDISTAPGNLLAILQSHGYPDTEIWITESGEPVNARPTAAELAQQAAYATDLIRTVAANPNVAADFWFSDQDIPAQGLWWGLRNGAGTQRPAFGAVKTAIAACGCSVG